MDNFISLKNVIDVEVLQEIQDKFATATGLAAITVDYRGNPVTRYSNFSTFCKLIRSNHICREACYQSDAHGGLEAARKRKPYIYRCHAGLVDFAVPIIVKDQYLGSLLAGQAKVENDKFMKLDKIMKEVYNWKNDQEILKAYEHIVHISYNKLVAAAQMMFIVSNYIVEKCINSFVQQELNSKKLELMEEMKKRVELEKEIKDLELKALQSQVNPHFLFNSLNTIARLALIEKANKTEEIVYALSDILRYTLKNVNRIVTIEEEVMHIERYMKIQSIRFGDRINFKIHIPDEIKKVKIPFMTLQPLVENAVIHGIEPKVDGGTIIVRGKSTHNQVIIEILDDGVGIPNEKLKDMLSNKQHSEDITNSIGIGLSNVNERLCYYFGSECRLKIESSIDVGTTIKVIIPKGGNQIND